MLCGKQRMTADSTQVRVAYTLGCCEWQQCACGAYYKAGTEHSCNHKRDPLIAAMSEANRKQRDLNLPPGVAPNEITGWLQPERIKHHE